MEYEENKMVDTKPIQQIVRELKQEVYKESVRNQRKSGTEYLNKRIKLETMFYILYKNEKL